MPKRLLTLASVAVLASGCVSMPQDRVLSDEPWTPATTEALTAWMRSYDQQTNQAAADHNPRALGRITGNVHQQTLAAEYRLADRADAKDAEPARSNHKDPTFYLPTLEDYPLWGTATSTDADTGGTVLDLLDRQSAGSDWRKLISVELDDGAELPELRVEGGQVVEAPLNEPGNLLRPPAQMARAFGGLLSATGSDSPFAVFEDHPTVTAQLEQNVVDDQAQNDGKATVEHEPARPTAVRAIETIDGGALVLTGFRDVRNITLKPGVSLALSDGVGTYTGEDSASGSIAVTTLWQVALYLPPESAGADQKAEILGVRQVIGNAKVG